MAGRPNRQPQPFPTWFSFWNKPAPGQPQPRAPTSSFSQPRAQPQRPPPEKLRTPSPSLSPSSSRRSTRSQPSDGSQPQQPPPTRATTQPPSPAASRKDLQQRSERQDASLPPGDSPSLSAASQLESTSKVASISEDPKPLSEKPRPLLEPGEQTATLTTSPSASPPFPTESQPDSPSKAAPISDDPKPLSEKPQPLLEPGEQTATLSTSPSTSPPLPTESPSAELKPLPDQSQPHLQTVPSTVTEPNLHSTSEKQEATPTQQTSTHGLEPKPILAASPIKDGTSKSIPTTPTPTPTQLLLSERQHEDNTEKKPITDPETKIEAKHSPLPKLVEKNVDGPKIGVEEVINGENQRSETIDEEIKETKPKTESEAKDNEPQAKLSGESNRSLESKISITEYDPKPIRPQLDSQQFTPEEMTKQDNLKEREVIRTVSGGNSHRITVSTIPSGSISNGERANFQKEVKEGLFKLIEKLGVRKQTGSEESVTIITLAGENKGATMIIGHHQPTNREGPTQSHKGHKLERGRFDETGNNVDTEFTVNINSNVQSINNSVLNHSSCSERDPGVHMILSSKPVKPVHLKGRTEPFKAQKNASNLIPAQKLTYNPNIRRRCLRSLFMESSESDIENSHKPRRHGCRYTCDEKMKQKWKETE